MTQPARSGDKFSKETFSEEALTYAEKFELLSAYLDDEATDEERCLVEHWLSSDLQLQQQYREQLKLRMAMRAAFGKSSANDIPTDIANTAILPSSPSPQPADQISKEPQSLRSLGAITGRTPVATDGISSVSTGASLRPSLSPLSSQRVLGL